MGTRETRPSEVLLNYGLPGLVKALTILILASFAASITFTI